LYLKSLLVCLSLLLPKVYAPKDIMSPRGALGFSDDACIVFAVLVEEVALRHPFTESHFSQAIPKQCQLPRLPRFFRGGGGMMVGVEWWWVGVVVAW
jgi:hypothetical protein